jgi:putative cardiolipin synthase
MRAMTRLPARAIPTLARSIVPALLLLSVAVAHAVAPGPSRPTTVPARAPATVPSAGPAAPSSDPMDVLAALVAEHGGASGSYVLERGEDALVARAWLADHARRTIEVQYFIWSSDNVGTIAAEALLRAADRGVKVRVIVDDLMIDAPDRLLLALAKHPNVDIRIYNPVHNVGTPWWQRLANIATDFRGSNERMHDKTFVVDGLVAITGGRNMADEYFDFDHDYNFRDRDALVLGPVARAIQASFDRFWANPLAVPVEKRFDGLGLQKKHVELGPDEARAIYADLRTYAAKPENFAPSVRHAIETLPSRFPEIAAAMAWGRVDFVSDVPGKNDNRIDLGGGGRTTAALAKLVAGAQKSVVIQSPYLVLSDPAMALFRQLRARGVQVRISTNSLASTDNLPAFSGYLSQRDDLIRMGVQVHEYRPDGEVRKKVMQRYEALKAEMPVFALHAKTMVVDGRIAFIGTYNLDPRSENLNTEVGVVIHDATQAAAVQASIETDMRPENSWRAEQDPDRYAPRWKRAKAQMMRVLPLRPIL